MRHRTNLLLPVIVGVVMLASHPAAAQVRVDSMLLTPEQVARLCVMKISDLAERCIQANHQRTARCLEEIADLLEAGEVEQAHRVAEACIAAMAEDTRLCLEQIEHLTRRCVSFLVAHGAYDLARHVHYAGRRAMMAVAHSYLRGVEAIHAAFETDGAG